MAGWYNKHKRDEDFDEEIFTYIIVKAQSIAEILSRNKNFSEVKIIKKNSKDIVLAKTNDGTLFKVNSIKKISPDDDNYNINFIEYHGSF